MFAIEVNFLTERYVATAHHNRNQPEWPPHPARLFSALVATWADADDPNHQEREALEWLESQPPPAICASDAVARSVVTHFVPVNDARVLSYGSRVEKIENLLLELEEAEATGNTKKINSLHKKIEKQRDVANVTSGAGKTPTRNAVDLLPPGWISIPNHVRTGQARAYPSVTPLTPRVTYIWDTEDGTDKASIIDGLCARLSRLGHSSSLVSCRTNQDPPTPNYTPGAGSDLMRGVRSGQLATLEKEYAKHQASKPRNLPFAAVRYQTKEKASGTHILSGDTRGEWIIFGFRPRSRMLPSTRSVEIATALRGAIFSYADDPIPEGLSGHRPDGSPSANPHVAFLPLPWVGHEHADGRVMGVAINVPYAVDDASRRATLRAIGKWEETCESLFLQLGPKGRIEMERIIGPAQLVSLRLGIWNRPSRRWVSVTPIALPTHPGKLNKGTAAARSKAWARAETSISRSCLHVGLPEPIVVSASLSPLVAGSRPAPSFPAFRQQQEVRRLVHAEVIFEQDIRGPLVLGAGRYLGLGLMRPIPERKPEDE